MEKVKFTKEETKELIAEAYTANQRHKVDSNKFTDEEIEEINAIHDATKK